MVVEIMDPHRVKVINMVETMDKPIYRYHAYKTKRSTKPTIAKNITPPEINTVEMKRQIDARNKITTKYFANDEAIQTDLEMSEKDSDNQNSMELDQDDKKLNKEKLKKKTVTQLKIFCRNKGLKVAGIKSKLIESLLNPTNPKHISNRK